VAKFVAGKEVKLVREIAESLAIESDPESFEGGFSLKEPRLEDMVHTFTII
jgi:hypothetical protein